MTPTHPQPCTTIAARRSGSSVYTVRPAPDGLWRIEATSGLVEGLFRTRRDAVRFAVFEMGGPGNAVVLDMVGDSARA